MRSGYWWYGDFSYLSTTHIGALQIGKHMPWASAVFDAFLAGVWFVVWTDTHLYWVAKPTVHTETSTGSRRPLHNDHGPACANDVENLYFLHGVLVPEWLVETPAEKLDPRKLTEIENAEERREFVRKVGIDRCWHKLAKVLHRDGDYELGTIDCGDGRQRPFLKMANPSVPEVWHVEGCHPDCKTVQEALNFRNSLTPDMIDEENGADWFQQGDVLLFPKDAKKFKSRPVMLT